MKTVVVTGANRGIGLGFCLYYLKTGWRVIALSRIEPSFSELDILTQEQESSFHYLEVDLNCEASISSLLAKTRLFTNSIELLINNAGVAEHESFGQWTQQAFMQSFLINAIAPALLIQTLSPLLAKSSKIIQLSSGLASCSQNLSPLEGFDGYSMSKAAVNMMTKRLSAKLSTKDVAVYAISPGWVKTKMGGEEASSTVSEAVSELTSTIKSLTLDDSGTFLDESGRVIPW